MPLEQVSEIHSRLVTSKNGKTKKQKFADYRCSYCNKTNEKQVGHAKLQESCGCQKGRLISEAAAGNKRRLKHGMKDLKIYKIWAAMVQRCSNPTCRDYKHYGGRGIAVCSRWLAFEAFFADMGERPDGCSLDRIDNSRGYEPENCKWSTKSQQQRNTRQNRILTINGTARCVAEWAEQSGAAQRDTIYKRLNSGWTEKEAVFGKSKDSTNVQ